MSRADSPESRPHQERLTAPPRLLGIDDEVVAFDGVQKTLLIHRSGKHLGRILERSDQLVVSRLPTAVLDVTWRNCHTSSVYGAQLIDPLDHGARFDPKLVTNNIFSAVIGINPEMAEQLWAENEHSFTQSERSISRQESPKTEYVRLLSEKLQRGLKLEVSTPTATYIASPESQQDWPVTFSWFQSYGWELFNEERPEPKSLYLPGSDYVGVLKAKFTYDGYAFDDDTLNPLLDGVPDLPLVGV